MKVRYTFDRLGKNILSTFLQDVNKFTGDGRNTTFDLTVIGQPTEESLEVNIIRADTEDPWKMEHIFSVTIFHF